MYGDDIDDFGYGGFGGGGGFGYAAMRRTQRQFREYYRAYPISEHPDGKLDANYGGKIFMPASALDTLSRLEVVYPLQFQLYNASAESGGKLTHCGVLEFTAEEGRVYLPEWMMETLMLNRGALVEAANVSLQLGNFVKLQPQSTDFLDITDHRAVLENALRKFTTLTVGDVFAISYNQRIYKIAVLETKPSTEGIAIVETDLSVDFAAPVGYVEPSRQDLSQSSRPASSMASDIRRREEKVKEEMQKSRFATADSIRSYASTPDGPCEVTVDEAALVPLDVPIGTLFFGYDLVPPPGAELDLPKDEKPKFSGEGNVLRARRKRK
ncbi:UFD1-domain-containing protein [Linderina pennispora]|uniref:UFD1-domain-containing protein n=1 Tax=Linderina pennispora TaxID=61395 RepID=A0A1Y1WEF2_9FUNG|nr:UFD1-domain-containing protein [Linderina pennispora]ORX71897.1 UFD1-domain-containing protein [Linderina pennispora]